jgi:hypothetical protein
MPGRTECRFEQAAAVWRVEEHDIDAARIETAQYFNTVCASHLDCGCAKASLCLFQASRQLRIPLDHQDPKCPA